MRVYEDYVDKTKLPRVLYYKYTIYGFIYFYPRIFYVYILYIRIRNTRRFRLVVTTRAVYDLLLYILYHCYKYATHTPPRQVGFATNNITIYTTTRIIPFIRSRTVRARTQYNKMSTYILYIILGDYIYDFQFRCRI